MAAVAEGNPRLVNLPLDGGSTDIDVDTGAERQLTELPPDFTVHDFDVSPDRRELVLEQEQQQSDIVLLEIPRS